MKDIMSLNANHNFNIPAGETITFGIQASYAEDVCEPENFELYSYGLVEENYTDSDMEIVMNAYSKLQIGFAEGNIIVMLPVQSMKHILIFSDTLQRGIMIPIGSTEKITMFLRSA